MNITGYTKLFLSSALVLITLRISACIAYPTGETSRIGSFFKVPKGMEAYQPFIYTYDSYYSSDSDPLKTEGSQIVGEWLKETGDSVIRKDIEVVLFQVNPNMFILACLYNKLSYVFEGNTFMNFLLKPQNKEYLNYLILLKQIEYIEFNLSDNWDDSYNRYYEYGVENSLFPRFCDEYIETYKNRATQCTHSFLKQRYQFQLAKLMVKMRRYNECKILIKEYFDAKPEYILNSGMMHYLGLCKMMEGDSIGANLCFMHSFRQANERKFRNIQLLRKDAATINRSINLTSDRSEKSLLVAMAALRNPGHALTQLKQIEDYDRNIPEFLFLIFREVNKLDDWISTPLYTNQSPSVTFANWDNSRNSFKQALDVNLINDKKYLLQLIDWMEKERVKFSAEPKQYMDLATVHLYLLNQDYPNAYRCFSSIKTGKQSPYYDLYRSENIFLCIIDPLFNNDKNLDKITLLMRSLEPEAKHNPLQCKMLITLNRILAYKMNRIGRNALSGLMRLKSEHYAELDVNSEYYYEYNINDPRSELTWFDSHATIADMDTLIGLSLLQNKKFYQSFYSDSIIGKTDLYRDLKGNMAYRNGNIVLAYNTYRQMDPKYWEAPSYKENFMEDPFIPKYWPAPRNFHYKFSKARFTAQLLDLIKQTKSQNNETASEAWLKLGHAYYNTTWWGNAWMMCQNYRSSTFDSYPYWDNDEPEDYTTPYYSCSRARTAYLNVLKFTKNKELQATASFMLHACDYNNATMKYELSPWDGRPSKPKYKTKYLINFLQKFQETKVYKEYLSNCSYLSDYMKQGFLNY